MGMFLTPLPVLVRASPAFDNADIPRHGLRRRSYERSVTLRSRNENTETRDKKLYVMLQIFVASVYLFSFTSAGTR